MLFESSKSAMTATDLYIVHIVEAAMEKWFSRRFYLTQVTIKLKPIEYGKTKMVQSEPDKPAYAARMRGGELQAFYTSPGRNPGLELPKVGAHFNLMQVHSHQRWEMYDMHVVLDDPGEKFLGAFDLGFVPGVTIGMPVPEDLRQLSRTLRDTSPRKR